MKKIALILMALTVLAGGVLLYALFHSSLTVTAKGMQAISAADRAADFDQHRLSLQRQSLLGTVLKGGELGAAENYTYYVYTLRLKNTGLVTAEMVEVQLSPMAGDILYYGETGEIDIAPGAERDVWCVLLTEGQPTPVREMYITYYLWGNPQEVKYTYDPTW